MESQSEHWAMGAPEYFDFTQRNASRALRSVKFVFSRHKHSHFGTTPMVSPRPVHQVTAHEFVL
jgi:hypothetical protein